MDGGERLDGTIPDSGRLRHANTTDNHAADKRNDTTASGWNNTTPNN